MVRRLGGYAIIAVFGVILLKFVGGLIGMLFSVVWTLFWLAAIGLVVYLILRIVNPDAARRVREGIRGRSETTP